jgi:hypothetical protein
MFHFGSFLWLGGYRYYVDSVAPPPPVSFGDKSVTPVKLCETEVLMCGLMEHPLSPKETKALHPCTTMKTKAHPYKNIGYLLT